MGAMLAQAFSDFETIHRVRPLKLGSNGSGLIALNLSDVVPNNVEIGAEIGHCTDFAQCFLQVAFAEVDLPRKRQIANSDLSLLFAYN
jgi:hypothetical protein